MDGTVSAVGPGLLACGCEYVNIWKLQADVRMASRSIAVPKGGMLSMQINDTAEVIDTL